MNMFFVCMAACCILNIVLSLNDTAIVGGRSLQAVPFAAIAGSFAMTHATIQTGKVAKQYLSTVGEKGISIELTNYFEHYRFNFEMMKMIDAVETHSPDTSVGSGASGSLGAFGSDHAIWWNPVSWGAYKKCIGIIRSRMKYDGDKHEEFCVDVIWQQGVWGNDGGGPDWNGFAIVLRSNCKRYKGENQAQRMGVAEKQLQETYDQVKLPKWIWKKECPRHNKRRLIFRSHKRKKGDCFKRAGPHTPKSKKITIHGGGGKGGGRYMRRDVNYPMIVNDGRVYIKAVMTNSDAAEIKIEVGRCKEMPGYQAPEDSKNTHECRDEFNINKAHIQYETDLVYDDDVFDDDDDDDDDDEDQLLLLEQALLSEFKNGNQGRIHRRSDPKRESRLTSKYNAY